MRANAIGSRSFFLLSFTISIVCSSLPIAHAGPSIKDLENFHGIKVQSHLDSQSLVLYYALSERGRSFIESTMLGPYQRLNKASSDAPEDFPTVRDIGKSFPVERTSITLHLTDR